MRLVKLFFIGIIILSLTMIAMADEIKPGVVIRKDNYERYRDSFKKLMPPGVAEMYEKGIKAGLVVIPVVEKKKYSPPKGFVEWSRKNKGICKIEPGNRLLNWRAGAPFLNPKNATEVAWNVRLWYDVGDQFKFREQDLHLFQGFKKERLIKMRSHRHLYKGRTEIPPIPEEPGNKEGIWRKEANVFIYPFDISPFALLRTQYIETYKDDNVLAYVPALRRVRRFTGSDVQDPLFGSDIIADDFACWYQKITPKMTFKYTVKDTLVPVRWDFQKLRKLNPFVAPEENMQWEIRPLYVLEVNINDPSYVYSKRVLYADKEDGFFTIYYGLFYDQRGRLFRSWSMSFFWDPKTHYMMWQQVIIHDHLSDHYTVVSMIGIPNDPVMTKDKFTIRWLIRRAR
jgi:hypothetical protein